MKKITIAKIAELAEVSQATVSRVLNDYPYISPEIRERVQRVIAETGFRPNAVARSLANNRTNMIGLIVPSIVQNIFSDPYFPSLIQGVAKACGIRRQILSLYLMNNLDEEAQIAENLVASSFVDGLILTLGDYDLVPKLAKSRIPFVTIGQPKNAEVISYVDADNITGGYLATKHLLELGHRRIGMIRVPSHLSGVHRYLGYQKALAECGLEVNEELVVDSDYSVESAYIAIRELLPKAPTAIFVSSDRMALGVLQVFKEVNIRVPEDIALVGFDNLSPALTASPPLTTVHQSVEEIGFTAVDLLLGVIERPHEGHKKVILPTSLIVRESCGGRAEAVMD